MIYVLEGPDGVGKTTLADAIAEEVGGTVIHPSFNKKWDMEAYHTIMIKAARDLDDAGIPVILDRWAPSEAVYGKVFRGGEAFDTDKLIKKYGDGIVWVYCWNENAVENHLKNMKKRKEMFDDMSNVVEEFHQYYNKHQELGWRQYNYNIIPKEEFIKELPR